MFVLGHILGLLIPVNVLALSTITYLCLGLPFAVVHCDLHSLFFVRSSTCPLQSIPQYYNKHANFRMLMPLKAVSQILTQTRQRKYQMLKMMKTTTMMMMMMMMMMVCVGSN